MAAAQDLINVYAFLPLTVRVIPGGDLDVGLDRPNNWVWVRCLAFPLEVLNGLHASQWSYKWIQYSIGIIVGSTGVLSTSRDSTIPVEGNDILSAGSIDLYYQTNNEEKQHMFPIDPDLANARITSTVSAKRDSRFHSRVPKRDGNRCALTGMDEKYCDAVHLIPHSKGKEYILTFCQRRRQDPTKNDVIQHIDSIRKGLFLSSTVHKGLGEDITFLRTPNFAMQSTDVDPTVSPAEEMCTSHVFQPTRREPMERYINPDARLRLSNTHLDPPAIVFDAVYAGAIVHNFGTQEMKDVLASTWGDIIYLGGIRNTAGAEQEARIGELAAAGERTAEQAQQRTTRAEIRSSHFDNTVQYWQKKVEEEAAPERRRVGEGRSV